MDRLEAAGCVGSVLVRPPNVGAGESCKTLRLSSAVALFESETVEGPVTHCKAICVVLRCVALAKDAV
jgi:hypothetical protein